MASGRISQETEFKVVFLGDGERYLECAACTETFIFEAPRVDDVPKFCPFCGRRSAPN